MTTPLSQIMVNSRIPCNSPPLEGGVGGGGLMNKLKKSREQKAFARDLRSDEREECCGKDKGGFKMRFHPHLTSPFKGEEFMWGFLQDTTFPPFLK